MKAIDWKSILRWWGKMLLREEKKQMGNNEEKPVQSTKRLRNFLNKRFDFRMEIITKWCYKMCHSNVLNVR